MMKLTIMNVVVDCVQSKPKELHKRTYALLEELAHREALARALAGRNDQALVPILLYLVRCITRPNSSALLIRVTHIILSTHTQLSPSSSSRSFAHPAVDDVSLSHTHRHLQRSGGSVQEGR
jgi:hypothetical protein